MQYGKIATIASLAILLCACAGTTHQEPVQPEVPAGVGNAAQHPPLAGPPRCTAAIKEYEKLIDRDVTTGYLSQTVYDQMVGQLNSGPRAACAANRDADAISQLTAVKHSHGYR
jgi:hypothetical protein